MKKQPKKPQLNAIEQAIFDDARADLEARRVFSEVDTVLLEAYAHELGQYFALLAELEREGYAVDTGTGSVKSNPKALRLESALKNSVNLARLLGLGPDSRKRLGINARRKSEGDTMKLIRRAN